MVRIPGGARADDTSSLRGPPPTNEEIFLVSPNPECEFLTPNHTLTPLHTHSLRLKRTRRGAPVPAHTRNPRAGRKPSTNEAAFLRQKIDNFSFVLGVFSACALHCPLCLAESRVDDGSRLVAPRWEGSHVLSPRHCRYRCPAAAWLRRATFCRRAGGGAGHRAGMFK